MDTILHQISLMDQVENEQELSEIIHSLLQAIGNYTGADRVYVFDWETDQKDSLSNTFDPHERRNDLGTVSTMHPVKLKYQ